MMMIMRGNQTHSNTEISDNGNMIAFFSVVFPAFLMIFKLL
jgi:hypothetical protein